MDETPTPNENQPVDNKPEKKLTSAEQREKMKEEYKKELLARKGILKQVKDAKKMNTLHKTMEELSKLGQDDSDEWIRKLNEESAKADAMFEIATGIDTTPHGSEEYSVEDILNSDGLVPKKKQAPTEESEETPPVENTGGKTLGDEVYGADEPDTDDGPREDLPPKKTLGDEEL